jgi:hypothetical protein
VNAAPEWRRLQPVTLPFYGALSSGQPPEQNESSDLSADEWSASARPPQDALARGRRAGGRRKGLRTYILTAPLPVRDALFGQGLEGEIELHALLFRQFVDHVRFPDGFGLREPVAVGVAFVAGVFAGNEGILVGGGIQRYQDPFRRSGTCYDTSARQVRPSAVNRFSSST